MLKTTCGFGGFYWKHNSKPISLNTSTFKQNFTVYTVLLHFYLTTSSVFTILGLWMCQYLPPEDHQEHNCSVESWVDCSLAVRETWEGTMRWLSKRVSERTYCTVGSGLLLSALGKGSGKQSFALGWALSGSGNNSVIGDLNKSYLGLDLG